MKYVILLASGDKDARANYIRLAGHRKATSSMTEQPLCTLLAYDKLQKKLMLDKNPELLKGALEEKRENVEIEFIAHGNDHKPTTLLIDPKRKDNEHRNQDSSIVLSEITPEVIVNFLKENISNDIGEFNFSTFTLCSCSGLSFGKELSILMPNVSIVCFSENIKIHNNGFVYPYDNKSNPIDRKGNVIPRDTEGNLTNPHLSALPHIFYSGLEHTSGTEKKSDSSTSTSTSSSETLSASQIQVPQRGIIFPNSPTLLNLAKQNPANKQTISSPSPKLESSPAKSPSNTNDDIQTDENSNDPPRPEFK